MKKIKNFISFLNESNKETFKFNELSEESKQKAIENYKEGDYLDFEFEFESILEEFEEELEKIGINDAEIQYSGFYSQGDGLSFTSDTIDTRKFLNSAGIGVKTLDLTSDEEKKTNSDLYDLIGDLQSIGQEKGTISPEDIGIIIKRSNSSRYFHENTIYSEVFILEEPEGWKEPEDFISDLEEKTIEFVRGICREFYKRLEDYYDDLNSDESISNFLEESDWEFDEDGNKI